MTDLSFLSPRLVFTDALVEQYRFPRSRKQRIREKWAKKSCNWRPSRKLMMSTDENGFVIYAHPCMEASLCAAVSAPL